MRVCSKVLRLRNRDTSYAMPDSVKTHKRYLLVLLATALSLLAGVLAYRVTNSDLIKSMTADNAFMTCNAQGLNESNFIAGCAAPLFGDYEHGALYFGLEATAVAHLRQAEVLILGNSKTMFAFSTAATESFFRRLGARIYLAGFGYGEFSRFPLALIRKHKLDPKAVIINADPFFDEQTDFQNVIDGEIGVYLVYLAKKYVQKWQRSHCTADERQSVWCGKALTVYRAVADGRWHSATYTANPNRIRIAGVQDYGSDYLANHRKAARQFRAQLRIPDRCIIMTLTPSVLTTSSVAQAIARDLNATYVVLPFDGYYTIDNVHLTPDDAERWSAEFLHRVEDVLRDCLRR
jgi:hypothetical protein